MLGFGFRVRVSHFPVCFASQTASLSLSVHRLVSPLFPVGLHRAGPLSADPSKRRTDGEAPAVSQEVALHCMIQAMLLAYRTGWAAWSICTHTHDALRQRQES